MTDEKLKAEVKKSLNKFKWSDALIWGAFVVIVIAVIAKL